MECRYSASYKLYTYVVPLNLLYCKQLEMSGSSKEEGSKKRAPNFSITEKTHLINIIHNFKEIIENKQTNATTWRQKDLTWTKITDSFNSQTQEGCFRTKEALKKYYENIKKNVRKEVAEAKKEINKTGGGTYEIKNDSLQELTLNLINKKTVFGLSNSFDGDSAVIYDIEDNLEHNYAENPKMSGVETDESGVCASNADKNVQEYTNSFSGHVIEPKTPCLKHTWSKRRRPTPQLPQPSIELNIEYIETAKVKRTCFEAELGNIQARKRHEEAIFELEKQKLLLEIDIKKEELKKFVNKQ